MERWGVIFSQRIYAMAMSYVIPRAEEEGKGKRGLGVLFCFPFLCTRGSVFFIHTTFERRVLTAAVAAGGRPFWLSDERRVKMTRANHGGFVGEGKEEKEKRKRHTNTHMHTYIFIIKQASARGPKSAWKASLGPPRHHNPRTRPTALF